ncbi:MAG: 3'-5' exonuclease [Candidatus Micrarchaeaceae archaeon]
MERTHHVMIDMETMSTEPDAALLSLGGVLFDPHGESVKDTFYGNVELQSCLDAGLRANAGTFYWWLTRSEFARTAVLGDRVPLCRALSDFTDWFRKSGASRIWSHGATFDIVVLERAYRALHLGPPYDFRDARDTRTLYDLAGLQYSKSEDTAHEALADAIRQAAFVQSAYRTLLHSRPGS